MEKLTSLTFVAAMIGGAPLTRTPAVLKSMEASIRDQVLQRLEVLLARNYSARIASWICTEWQLLEEQTFKLFNYLKDTKKESKKDYDILTLSKAVDIAGQFRDFVAVSKFFLSHPRSAWVLRYIQNRPHE